MATDQHSLSAAYAADGPHGLLAAIARRWDEASRVRGKNRPAELADITPAAMRTMAAVLRHYVITPPNTMPVEPASLTSAATTVTIPADSLTVGQPLALSAVGVFDSSNVEPFISISVPPASATGWPRELDGSPAPGTAEDVAALAMLPDVLADRIEQQDAELSELFSAPSAVSFEGYWDTDEAPALFAAPKQVAEDADADPKAPPLNLNPPTTWGIPSQRRYS